MLHWSRQFSILLFLDSNDYPSAHSGYECLLGVNAVSVIGSDASDSLAAIHQWHLLHNDWLFGHISYDFKNTLEPKLSSSHSSGLAFPVIQFFCPAIVCFIDRDKETFCIECLGQDPHTVYHEILNTPVSPKEVKLPSLQFTQRIPKQEYLSTIDALREHIRNGDCYEINFCNEGFVESAVISPVEVFQMLNTLSPAPFAAFYRLNDQFMMCASPERYLMKHGETLLSQPIKGTSKRENDATKDQASKLSLQNSMKDRAENVMIVDLVRNDLARSCQLGSVQVPELFGIHSFPQVHQMVSTITGHLRPGVPFTNALRYSFPMGSMTGAPKVKVMQLIENYERSYRGLFSGTVGYITPSGNFDFNVVIRSIFYNEASRYLSYQTGGAITYDSDAVQEWEEMRLKAWALEKIFA